MLIQPIAGHRPTWENHCVVIGTTNMSAPPERIGIRRLILWGAILFLLLAPLIAMQFTDQVAWTTTDFVMAAMLLIGAGATYEVAAHHIPDAKRRIALGLALAIVVLIAWAQGAVGIF
jgi:hypothetical protein